MNTMMMTIMISILNVNVDDYDDDDDGGDDDDDDDDDDDTAHFIQPANALHAHCGPRHVLPEVYQL